MIDTVLHYGGDVIKFAGDALISSFVVDDWSEDDYVRDAESANANAYLPAATGVGTGGTGGTGGVGTSQPDQSAQHQQANGSAAPATATACAGGLQSDRSMPSIDCDMDRASMRCTYAAVACALKVLNNIAQLKTHVKYELDVHVGVVSGDLHFLSGGGTDKMWEFILAGEPLLNLQAVVHGSGKG